MNRFVLAIMGAGAAHFAELIAAERDGKETHGTSGILSVALVAISRLALGGADIIVGSEFDQCEAGKDAP